MKTYKDIKVDSFLVSVTFDDQNNPTLLVVGKKKKNEAVDIVNALQGEDAARLYWDLITKKG